MSNEQFGGEQNVVLTKSFAFAVRMVKLNKHLRSTHQEYVLSKQLVRCGTSIGANVEEAIGGISKADFSAKISIACKEARETSYWLRLLHEAEYLDSKLFIPCTVTVRSCAKSCFPSCALPAAPE